MADKPLDSGTFGRIDQPRGYGHGAVPPGWIHDDGGNCQPVAEFPPSDFEVFACPI